MDPGKQRRVCEFGGFTLDMGGRSLRKGEQDCSLTPKEFQTLALLVEAAGQAVSRETLMTAIWPDTVVGDTSLARNVSALRRHLGPSAIEVVPKYGYRFTLLVTVASGQTAPGEAIVPLVSEAKVVSLPSTRLHRGAPVWVLGGIIFAVVLLTGAKVLTRTHAAQSSDSVWTDPQTKLMWQREDNGAHLPSRQANINRQEAIDYCKRLSLAGYTDWRLPAIDELQTLYDTSVSIPGYWEEIRPVYWHVKGNVHLTGGPSAANVTLDSGEEQTFDFSYGRRNLNDVTFRAGHRALCVRP